MPGLVELLDVNAVPQGEARPAQVDGKWYAVSNDGGTFHVTDIHCPHEHGPLGRAEVRDGCLICPVHHWPWNLKTGLTADNMPCLRLNRYPCEVRDGKVWADVSTPLPPDPGNIGFDQQS